MKIQLNQELCMYIIIIIFTSNNDIFRRYISSYNILKTIIEIVLLS